MDDQDALTTVVVLDVNVFIDVAELLGAPFTWEKFEAKAAEVKSLPVPYVADERIDCLRAISYCRQAEVIPGEPLEVWTSKHIDDLVAHKAEQPTTANRPEDRGLGWSRADALELTERLVRDLVEETYGDTVKEIQGHIWTRPLSHEDGCVYKTAYQAGDDELSPRICVTRDGPFRQANLGPRVTLYHPDEFILYLRDARKPKGLGPAALMQGR